MPKFWNCKFGAKFGIAQILHPRWRSPNGTSDHYSYHTFQWQWSFHFWIRRQRLEVTPMHKRNKSHKRAHLSHTCTHNEPPRDSRSQIEFPSTKTKTIPVGRHPQRIRPQLRRRGRRRRRKGFELSDRSWRSRHVSYPNPDRSGIRFFPHFPFSFIQQLGSKHRAEIACFCFIFSNRILRFDQRFLLFLKNLRHFFVGIELHVLG